jgi:hypothetical protein
VAEHIVDILELVEIEYQQPCPPIIPLGFVQSLLQAIEEQGPVRQAGEGVVEGEITGAFLHPATFGDVPADPREPDHGALGILDR